MAKGLMPFLSILQHSTTPSSHAAHQENGRRKYCDSNKLNKFRYILIIALIHFGLSVVIMPITMSVAGTLNAAQSTSTMGLKTLVVVTRILHFPIISLSWYSRQWFPGDWIRIPMLINSCLWAAGILCLVIFCRKMRGRL